MAAMSHSRMSIKSLCTFIPPIVSASPFSAHLARYITEVKVSGPLTVILLHAARHAAF